jgi:uncharacterized protein YcfJ
MNRQHFRNIIFKRTAIAINRKTVEELAGEATGGLIGEELGDMVAPGIGGEVGSAIGGALGKKVVDEAEGWWSKHKKAK